MADLLGDPAWPQLHPRPYTDTPLPGLQCELAPDDARVLHTTRLHLAPDVTTPPCRPGARLDPASLRGLPHLRMLSVFVCFDVDRAVHVVVLARADCAQVQPRPHRPHTGDVERGLTMRLGKNDSYCYTSSACFTLQFDYLIPPMGMDKCSANG
ncbi:uncharacterized protein [Zea mays]|uniref:uncharacterized protein n=1 Tax=Zea mays TaxID=4577 RepID=UPI0004DE7F9D|nr:uncharacterized protein LOC103642619 [Zea mays]|eukprot:XP_008664072.1 uncharacterized protein LOC103642619 [Zea mays]